MNHQFEKYQHIERFNTSETRGIDIGLCYIFPKIDGTNGSVWFYKGAIKTGSRRRELSVDDDNAGFHREMSENKNIKELFSKHPDLRLYGEWLVPHTLRTYEQDAWRKFYVFDVMLDKRYLPYEDYKKILDEFNIDYIPPICKIQNPSYEKLTGLLDTNTFLIKDGEGTGEGIVIKNYDYKNGYGRVTWAKIVKNEFKTKHAKVNDVTELKEKQAVEQMIVDKYVTESLVEKEYAKIDIEKGFTSRDIPRLLNVVFHCLVKEESYNFIKEFKNPTINYSILNFMTIKKIKDLKPEIFR